MHIELLHITIILFLLQIVLLSFSCGLLVMWIIMRKTFVTSNETPVSPTHKNVENLLKKNKTLPHPQVLEDFKKPKKSTVMHYPTPESVRAKQEEENMRDYLNDLTKKKRPSGSFAL